MTSLLEQLANTYQTQFEELFYEEASNQLDRYIDEHGEPWNPIDDMDTMRKVVDTLYAVYMTQEEVEYYDILAQEYGTRTDVHEALFSLLYDRVNWFSSQWRNLFQEIIEHAKDRRSYERNPLGYHGLRQSDFL